MKEVYRAVASVVLVRPFAACEPSGCGVIFQVLLLHKPRKRDSWQLPQGGIEEGEDVHRAALRELMEEAGVEGVRVLGLSERVYQYNFPASYRRLRPDCVCGQRVEYILAFTDGTTVVCVDGKEVDQYAWVYPSQLHLYIHRREYLALVRSLVEEAKEGAVLLGGVGQSSV